MNHKNRRWISTFLAIIFIVQMFGGYALAASENDILKETKCSFSLKQEQFLMNRKL